MRISQIHKTFLLYFIAVAMIFPTFAAAQSGTSGLKVVCIDAGHGGTDPGAINKYKGKRYNEKDFTLDIAKALEKKIKEAYPDVKVVMTRTKDVYVSLKRRGDIANNAKADLFISIHINAIGGKKDVSGFSVHCLGESRDPSRDNFKENMEVCRRENAAFSAEEVGEALNIDPNDPSSTMIFTLAQNVHLEQSLDFGERVQREMKKGPVKKDRGIWQQSLYVLKVTSMPAVLIECGYITNANDMATLTTDTGRKEIAGCLFKAFKSYKTSFDQNVFSSSSSEAPSFVEEEAPAQEGGQSQAQVLYGTQILAGSKLLPWNDSAFKGYKVIAVKVGNLYKYIAGTDSDPKKAREIFKRIKKTFPQAFFVKTDGETVEIAK